MADKCTLDKSERAPACQERGIEFAGLFGSQARGEASSESDVDLLVRIEREIGEVIGHSVDLVTENALSPYLRDWAMADLEVIVDDE